MTPSFGLTTLSHTVVNPAPGMATATLSLPLAVEGLQLPEIDLAVNTAGYGSTRWSSRIVA
jgi:hypothetical protein